MENKAGTIFIVDDDKSIRRSLSVFLMAYDYQVETYASSEEYLEREPFTGPGCIIIDVMLEGKSGLDLQEELLALGSHLPVIFITGQGNIHMSVQTMRRGALNFLEKPFKDDELLQAVSEAMILSWSMQAETDEIRTAVSLVKSLTSREYEILKYLITGMLNKQIAHELQISERTIKIHRRNICVKLGVKSVPEIIRIADRARVLPFRNDH